MPTTQSVLAGRYRLVRPLGQGGMGRVWLARDEVLHRDVAVKEVTPPEGLPPEERANLGERSRREARAIARLTEPHVVRVYDIVEQEPWPYIVMEYVPSRSLDQVLREDGVLDPADAARVGLGVLAALRAVHRIGMLHRDVKPGNVLLADDGRVVLTDFGLATGGDTDATVTRPGLILGSPAFMAPERAATGVSTPEADLWSLGATLFAAVEGKPPYARPTSMATLAALASEEPDPAPHAGPLGQVLRGLLRRDPAQRMPEQEVERRLRRVAGTARRTRPLPAPTPTTPASTTPPSTTPAPTTPALPTPARTTPARTTMTPTTTASPSAASRLTRRPPWVVLAAAGALAVLLALAVALVLTHRAPRAGTEFHPPAIAPATSRPAASQPPASPTASPSPSAAPSRTAGPSTGAGFVMPAGWHRYRDPSGFSVAIPNGWTRSQSGSIVYFHQPGGGRLLGIDQTDQPKPDPLADWAEQEQYRVSHGDFPGYRRVRLVRVPYFRSAADWEFSYDGSGGRVHVNNRGVITSAHQAYGFWWQVPDRQWSAALPDLRIVYASFQPRT
jgi:eukaryotic-like serine/threonine-protein kinase